MGPWIALRPERSIRKTLRGLVARQMGRQRVANGVRTKAPVRGGGLMARERRCGCLRSRLNKEHLGRPKFLSRDGAMLGSLTQTSDLT
jgi:hypothetical protein